MAEPVTIDADDLACLADLARRHLDEHAELDSDAAYDVIWRAFLALTKQAPDTFAPHLARWTRELTPQEPHTFALHLVRWVREDDDGEQVS